MKRFEVKFKNNLVWNKMAVMLAVVFFLYFGDAVISEFLPSYIQNSLGGSLIMGLMMSFSSIIGFAADLIFPQLFKKTSSRKMVMLAISSVFVTAGVLIWTTHFVIPAIFLLAMGTWGVYYEFLHFGMSQFVVQTAPTNERAGVWSMISVFKSVAYCVGPLAGTWLYLLKGSTLVILAYAIFALAAYLVWFALGIKNHEMSEHLNEVDRFNIIEEVGHWVVLFEHVWPILIVSLTLGIVDAAFWTTGVIMSDQLLKQSWLGSFFVSAYILPSVFMGLIVARLGIYKGKKKLSELFMLLSGITMLVFGVTGSVYVLILVAFIIGILTAVAWPLVDAVYSDISSRMGREQKHMMGLSSSTVNLSYITGPVIAGLLASRVGEARTMMYIGIFVVLISIILLMVTPKKLKLPQKDIAQWDIDK
jgi:MFS family permease